MKNKTFNKQLFTLVETENLYEPYTGRRIGYKFKAEYKFKKTQEEAIYFRVNITCREIIKNGDKMNCEVSIACAPYGIYENTMFVVNDLIKRGSEKMSRAITEEADYKLGIIKQAENYEKSKQK